jgi:hypothetical protein
MQTYWFVVVRVPFCWKDNLKICCFWFIWYNARKVSHKWGQELAFQNSAIWIDLLLKKQMHSVWLIRLTDTNCQHTWYLQNKYLLCDSSGIQTPTINILGTYKTNTFCVTHQAYRHQPSTYLVLTKQIHSVWLIRHTNTGWQHTW